MNDLISQLAAQHMMQYVHETNIRAYTRDIILAVAAELSLNGYDDAAALVLQQFGEL